MRIHISAFFYLVCFLVVTETNGQRIRPDFLINYKPLWVDSVFKTMSLDQKIGQLLMPRANFSGQPHDTVKLKEWVQKYHIGGLVFFASGPTAQVRITNSLQAQSKVPLFIGQDFEWGVGMRLDSTDRFPYAVAQGAILGNTELMERMGREVARQCKRLGVHINYAPVVDVNNNPANPVINFRSYGSDKENVADKAVAYMKGMQAGGILCTAKHFPGHGDTNVDSHHDLPLIPHPTDRLHDIELYPFKKLIDHGLSGVMTAHLEVPALEQTKGLASTFSEKIVQDLLQRELQFEGLTFTDAMDMQGAVKNFSKGEAMIRALLAGNDVLETFVDVPGAFAAIKEAVAKGIIPMRLLDQKVLKILKAKSWVGLNRYQPVETSHLLEDLNTVEADVIHHQMMEKSITCLRNDGDVLPFKNLDQTYAVLSLESAEETPFCRMVRQYVQADYYSLPKEAGDSLTEHILNQIKKYDHVIAGIHLVDIRASKKYGLNDRNISVISRLAGMEHVTLCLLGNPLVLKRIPALAGSSRLVLAYQQNKYTESIVPQVLFGALPAEGVLPLIVNDTFPMGSGIRLPSLGRLTYGVPELAGIDRVSLYSGIDSIMYAAIREGAFPGGVVQVAVKGRVILQKAFGFHTYQNDPGATQMPEINQTGFQRIDDAMDNSVDYSTTLSSFQEPTSYPGQTKTDDLFDLASVTKISTSTLAVMQLISEGKMELAAPLGRYFPPFQKTNKAGLTMHSLLTHTAGLQAWIPFWKDAVDLQATFNKSVALYPDLMQECVMAIKKPGFFKRLFGGKEKKYVDVQATLQKNPAAWSKLVLQETRTWKKNIFYNVKTVKYPVRISDGMYLHRDYEQTILKQIADSPVDASQGYVYSDLHFYLYPQIVPKLTGLSFSDYLNKTYRSLGANSLQFNPVQSNSLEKIVPTEYDSLFRQTLVHGYVHDEGAALLGGISGHAGLFGNANDMTKLMQMYLNQGSYGGKQYILPEVVRTCTSYQFPEKRIRRGIGFDKKDFDPAVVNAPTTGSSEGFGHSGFTGTYVWADPTYDLVYVVLTNRVYPTRYNPKISTLSVRPAIGDYIIQHLKK